MMKVMKLVVIIIAYLMAANTYAAKYKFIAMDNSQETKVCVHAGNNERKDLINSINAFAVDQKLLVNKLRCNDIHIANFARKYNADSTFKYLKKYSHRRYLNKTTNIFIKDIANNEQKKVLQEKVILVYVSK